MRRVKPRHKLTVPEQLIYDACMRMAIEAAHIGPVSLGQYAAIKRYAYEEFLAHFNLPIPPLSVYGLTLHEQIDRQMRPCEICGREASRKVVNCIDHDHVTGRLRGTLCRGCNIALGMSTNDPDTEIWARSYLLKWAGGCEGDLANGHLTEIKWTSWTSTFRSRYKMLRETS